MQNIGEVRPIDCFEVLRTRGKLKAAYSVARWFRSAPNSIFTLLAFSLLTHLSEEEPSRARLLREAIRQSIAKQKVYYTNYTRSNPMIDRLLEEGKLASEFHTVLELGSRSQAEDIEQQMMSNGWPFQVATVMLRSLALTAAIQCGKSEPSLMALADVKSLCEVESLLILCDYLQIELNLFDQKNHYHVDGEVCRLDVFIDETGDLYLLESSQTKTAKKLIGKRDQSGHRVQQNPEEPPEDYLAVRVKMVSSSAQTNLSCFTKQQAKPTRPPTSTQQRKSILGVEDSRYAGRTTLGTPPKFRGTPWEEQRQVKR